MPERITYPTPDGINIVGDWQAAPTTIGAVVLLHMMPTDRKSWAAFQPQLAERGLASLAIDLRGHGESTEPREGGPVDFQRFSDEEHQSSIFDVIGAVAWLRRRGFELPRIAVVGASIGANLAIQMLLEEPQLAGAALLSPGENYHGTNAIDDARTVLPHQALWVAASEEDDQASFEAAKSVHDIVASERKVFVPLKNAGHGTKILESHPEVAESLANWLRDVIHGV